MRAGIIGCGQTEHRSRRLDVSAPELIDEAVQRALVDAALEPDGIDAIVVGNMEHFEGIHLSDLWAVEGTGGVGKPQLKVATGGTTGSSLAQAAYYLVAGGLFRTVMAVGWERLSDSEGETTTGIVTAFDPIYERPTLAGAVSGLAIWACDYQNRYGTLPEQAAQVVIQARENAARNPHAHLRAPLTTDEVLASPMLSSPMRYLDMCPTSDGACAVVFTSDPGTRKAAWVDAVASCHNHTYLGDVDEKHTLELAAAEAYKEAGITDPARQFDVIEMYEPCTWAALDWVEALGLCERGRAPELWADGVTRMDGELPMNPSGGVLCTNPIGATGLIRVAEASMQVRGTAGERQVQGARKALTTGFGGSFWNEVMILGGRSMTEPFVLHATPELTYRHAAGRYGSLFLRGLRDGKILASRCAACDRTLVPPRVACTGCFGRMEEIVELPPRGTLLNFTVVSFPFLDPATGVQRPIPYGYGMIRFEGATNTFQYFLSEDDPARLRVGMAVEAVFRDTTRGEIADLVHFKPLEA